MPSEDTPTAVGSTDTVTKASLGMGVDSLRFDDPRCQVRIR
jgi:hypothetical protein